MFQEKRIRDVATLYRGVSYKKEQARKLPYSGAIPIIRANNIVNGHFDLSDLIYVPVELVSSSQKVSRGDIVVTMSSGSKSHVGKAAICKSQVEIAFGAFCAKLSADSILPDYLFYFLFGSRFRKYIEVQSKGTNINNIKADHILDCSIPVPSLPEQERIVARIEELFSQLDAGVETLKKTKAQLAVYRQAVFASVIGKYDGVEKKLSDVALTIDGDRGKNYPKKEEFTKEGYCLFLTAANVKPYGWAFENNTFVSKEKDSILHGGRLEKNDIVITTRGTLGNIAVYDDTVPFEAVRINSCMLIVRVKDTSVSPYYLAQYLMSPMFKYQVAKLKTGTAQPQIPANVLREIPLKIPTVEVQKTIIAELTEEFSVCDSIEQTVDTALQQAEAMRQSILKDAFEGRL